MHNYILPNRMRILDFSAPNCSSASLHAEYRVCVYLLSGRLSSLMRVIMQKTMIVHGCKFLVHTSLDITLYVM